MLQKSSCKGNYFSLLSSDDNSNWKAQSKNNPLIFRPFLKVFRSSWILACGHFQKWPKNQGIVLALSPPINAIEYTNTKVFSFNKIVCRINHFISLNLQCKPINRFNELTSISSYNIGLPRQPSASALRLTKMLQNAQKHGHQNHSILKAGSVESSYLICDLSNWCFNS